MGDMDTMELKDASEKVQTPRATGHFGAPGQRSKLAPIRRPAVEKRLAAMPAIYRSGYLRAMAGRSPTAAIKSFCLECVGWQRAEVTRCTALACPLYGYRPFRATKEAPMSDAGAE